MSSWPSFAVACFCFLFHIRRGGGGGWSGAASLVVLGGLFDQFVVAGGSLRLCIERGGKDGETPDAVLASSKWIACSLHGFDGRTLARDLDRFHAGHVSAQPVEPVLSLGVDREHVRTVGRARDTPVLFCERGLVGFGVAL